MRHLVMLGALAATTLVAGTPATAKTLRWTSQGDILTFEAMAQTEIDDKKRNGMMREVLVIHASDVGHIPLHQQVIPWAMRSNVTAFHRADNRLDVRWVRID